MHRFGKIRNTSFVTIVRLSIKRPLLPFLLLRHAGMLTSRFRAMFGLLLKRIQIPIFLSTCSSTKTFSLSFKIPLFRKMAIPVSHTFSASLGIIGVNPYVSLPGEVLAAIFLQAGKEKGNIPVQGTVNGKPYRQTLVRYRNDWRLYINQTMLAKSTKRIGETISITISFDNEDRTLTPHPKLVAALHQNDEANAVFQRLRPSLQHEIIRYISFLKSEQTIDKNIDRAILFLLGKTNFIGRKKPG